MVLFEHEIVLETCGNSLFRDHSDYSSWKLILD